MELDLYFHVDVDCYFDFDFLIFIFDFMYSCIKVVSCNLVRF